MGLLARCGNGWIAGGDPSPTADAIMDANCDQSFDPAGHRFGPSRYFEDFVLGEAFYIPSRTVTEAQFLAFQAASGDNHRSTTTASTVVATATRTCWRTDTRC